MYTIYHDFVVNVSKEKFFEAVSKPTGLNNWWTLQCSGYPKLEEVYNLNFTDEFNWFAKISKFEENKCIEFSMAEAMEEWLPTKFGFKLHEINSEKTEIEFYHSNWKEITKEYRIASFCWAMLLNQLKDYLEKGIITPFSERN